MTKLILLFSHKLTNEQMGSAEKELNVNEFVYLPSDLQEKWSNVPPDADELADYLNPIKEWVKSVSNKGDYILIQGDFGVSYLMVQWAFDNGYIPVYATTKRNVVEIEENGETVTIRKFQHCKFRKYGV